MFPPLEECSPTARTTIIEPRAVIVESFKHEPQPIALRHIDDVQQGPIENNVGALAGEYQLADASLRLDSETCLYALPEQRLGRIPGSGGSAPCRR
jgi:hypothetical protein